jgi:hypothetical protein
MTFKNIIESNGFDVGFESNCLGSGLFKPLTSPSVFNGYVLQVTNGTTTRRMGLIEHRNSGGVRTTDFVNGANNFGVNSTGSGKFVVIADDRDSRDDKPQFFDFSYESRP